MNVEGKTRSQIRLSLASQKVVYFPTLAKIVSQTMSYSGIIKTSRD